MNTHSRLVRWPIAVAVLGLGGLVLPAPASAQTIGTFQFALQPYCNQVSMTITQEGSTYRLAGWDDACGANERHPLRGVITGNADGTLHFAFTVTRPNGVSVETSVRNFNIGSLNGNWTDSAGNSGTFPLAGAPGGSGARPGPTSTVPTNSVTTVNIVDGSIAAADVNPAQVQLRVSGTCPTGQAVRGVNADGSVVCGAAASAVIEGNEVSVFNGITGTCEDLDAISFSSAPAGRLSCSAVVTANFAHANGTVDHLEFDIVSVPASTPGACSGLNRSVYEMPAEAPSALGHDVSVSVHRWFGLIASGPTVLYLNARTGGTNATVFASQFTCTIVPQ